MRIKNRISTLALVVGLGFAAPVMLPTAAMAQSTISQQEQTLQAQITALAQAGDIAGMRALIANGVRNGNAAMLARVARRVASLAQQIASTDAASSAQLVNAAVLIAGNSSVAAADSGENGLSIVVGQAAASIVAAVQNTDPNAAATIQTTVAVEGNTNLQIAYTSPPNVNTNTLTQTVPTTTRPTLTRRPVIPTEPVIPIVPEPNPTQVQSQVNIVIPVNGNGEQGRDQSASPT